LPKRRSRGSRSVSAKAAVTVTGAGSLFGQGIIKCLRMDDLPVQILGLDYFKDAIGFEWCDGAGLLPDLLHPQVSEDAWFADLCRQVSSAGSRVLFVGADFELIPLATRAQELIDRTGCRAIVSSRGVIDVCKDKHRTAQWLAEINEPTPESFLPDSSVEAMEDAIGYPMIVKPRFGSRSRGVVRVADRAQLERAVLETEAPVVQRFLPGEDMEYSCGVVTFDGRVDTVAVLRRRLKDGNTISAVSDEPSPGIEALCRRVGEALKPLGPINIQLRLVEDTPYIFEINPRFSGTTIFRAHLGINEPARVLRHALNLRLTVPPKLRKGRVRRYFDEIVDQPVQALRQVPELISGAP